MKKKTIRNVIASILVLVMTMALFAGCELAPTETTAPAETEPPKVEALNYDLYYHVTPTTKYAIDAKDNTVHMTLYNKGKSLTARVADLAVAGNIKGEMVVVLEKNDKGIVTGCKSVTEIGASYACRLNYITEVKGDEITVDSGAKIKLTSKTVMTDVTGKTSVGNTVKLRVGDCITAVADSNGDISHVFKAVAVSATKKANCEHCGKEVTWTAYYGDNNSLPTATGHYYLVDDMLGKATTIAKNATVCFDLNGHTVTFPATQRLVSMNNGGNTFALMDTSEAKTGIIKTTKGNAAVNGGIVWANKGSFYMYGGTIDASQMTNNGFGCAVYVGDNTSKSKVNTTFKMTGGKIIGGISEYDPAGTGGNGGAIYACTSGTNETTIEITGGEIVGGKAVDNTTGTPRGKGGAMYIGSKVVASITGGSITGGEASGDGPCVWVAETGKFTVADGVKVDNIFQVQPAAPAEPAA